MTFLMLGACSATAPVFVDEKTSAASAQSVPTPPVAPQSDVTDRPPDGLYSGLSILTSFHGDCNAGGTGEILFNAGQVTYHDARNPILVGPLGKDGSVDLVSGQTRLTGRLEGTQFIGSIDGGPCGYDMKFDHLGN